MRRRTKTNLLIAGIVLLLLAILVLLRQKAPPEAARLLPESEGIVYFNLMPLRAATHFENRPVPHDPAYQHFIDATGFVFERDLSEAAFALHRMPDPHGPNGAVAFSEVFVGHFEGKRLTHYLESLSNAREDYAGHTIYSIPTEQGRVLRVALLGYDIVAASNAPTPEQIHSILDRYRTAALPFTGSSVLSEYYRQVPALSLAWGIGKLTLPLSEAGGPEVFGMRLPVSPDTALIASVRWFGSLHLRVEEIAPTPAAADNAANTARALTGLLQSAESTLPGDNSADMRSLLDSAHIQSKGNRAVLTAVVPFSLVEKAVAPGDTGITPTLGESADPQSTTPPPTPPPAPKGKHKRHFAHPNSP